jgi:hypothetical protein
LEVANATQPFEFVLGQSLNAGWHAVAEPATGASKGSRSVTLGSPELVDAFANGWHISSTDLAALGAAGSRGAFTIDLTWSPQHNEDLALAVSVLGVVFCIVIGFVPERLRRFLRIRKWGRHRSVQSKTSAGETIREVPGAVEQPERLVGQQFPNPVLALPLSRHGTRPGVLTTLSIALVSGAVAGAVTGPLVGLAVGIAIAVALFVRPVRAVISLVAVGLLVAGALSVIIGQGLHPIAESAYWPDVYQSAAVMVWMAVVFLGADAVVERTWEREASD